jgi:hypothetical protein
MSPRRLGVNATLWSYRYLALRDGERCQLCGKNPATQNNGYHVAEKLERDHIDGDPWNEEPDNLRLLCKKCNIAVRNRASCAPRGDSAYNERKRTFPPVASRIVKTVVDYSSPTATAPMQAADQFEEPYKDWVCKQVRESGYHGYSEQDAIYGGSTVVGCASSTARNYLLQLLSSAGPLMHHKDMLCGWILEFKDRARQAAFAIEESPQVQSQAQTVKMV